MVREEDTEDTLKEKIYAAVWMGVIQSKLVEFPYLRKIWKHNTEEERLLGVSLTGIYDNPLTHSPDPEMLQRLKEWTVEIATEAADTLGIPVPTATTCVKPSGTVSQLVDSASGIHPRFSKFYIRSVRGSNKDAMTQFLKAKGIPWEPAFGDEDYTSVFFFPTSSPKGSLSRDEVSTLDHLKLWKIYQEHWCEHKPSATINVKDHEWIDVAKFVFDNIGSMTGVSFLPYSGGSYKQAPYQEVTEEEYNSAKAKMPESIDWSELSQYEHEDSTKGAQTAACSAGVCEIVDI